MGSELATNDFPEQHISAALHNACGRLTFAIARHCAAMAPAAELVDISLAAWFSALYPVWCWLRRWRQKGSSTRSVTAIRCGTFVVSILGVGAAVWLDVQGKGIYLIGPISKGFSLLVMLCLEVVFSSSAKTT